MIRVIIGLVLLISIAVFVRMQFHSVIGQITSKNPRPVFNTALSSGRERQDSRIKCMMCNGTGRSAFGGFGKNKSQACASCNGMGWVDNPMYGR